MSKKLKHKEINRQTIKLIIGVIALSLASLTSFFSESAIESISAAYHEDGWARNIFVGFLFSIAAFLLAYNGKSITEMLLSKVAALSAIGVAMFPCDCNGHEQIIPYVHGVSAGVMFGVLAFFCYKFYERAQAKNHFRARLRAAIYAICGVVIVGSIVVLALDHLLEGVISSKVSRLTFYGEAAGLISFGVAWLSASRVLPLITLTDERHSLSPFKQG